MNGVNVVARAENASEGYEERRLEAVSIEHPEFSEVIVLVVDFFVFGSKPVDGQVREVASYRGFYIAANQIEHLPIGRFGECGSALRHHAITLACGFAFGSNDFFRQQVFQDLQARITAL
jgi:hypothetical protein